MDEHAFSMPESNRKIRCRNIRPLNFIYYNNYTIEKLEIQIKSA